MDSTIKLAISGAGFIADFHANAVRTLPDTELVAVVDRYERTSRAFANKFDIPRHYQSVSDLLSDGDVDGLLVATPNYMHAPQTIAALEARLHVLVEKPMAMSTEEAKSMIAASEESDRVLMVGHCWQFDEEILWLREQVDAGKLGRIIRTKGYGVHSNAGPSGWFTEKKLAGGGALVDMGIHAIDTTRFFIGDPQPVSVYARIGTYYKDLDVDDTGVILVEWDNNVVSYLESGWWQPHMDGPEAATQLYGTTGFGEVFPTRIKIANDVIDPSYPFPRVDHCPQEMYDSQLRYFCQCIRDGSVPNPGGREGLVNMKILEAAYESAGTGKVVEISVMSSAQ